MTTAREATATFEEGQAPAGILDEWIWLIGAQRRALLLTASGNAFLEDEQDGSMLFLDVNLAKITSVAASRTAFDALLADPDFVEAYFNLPLLRELGARGQRLALGQVYSFSLPWSLGGAASADNVEALDAAVHFSISGQVARQVADLPEGAAISGLKLALPRRGKPWWRFW